MRVLEFGDCEIGREFEGSFARFFRQRRDVLGVFDEVAAREFDGHGEDVLGGGADSLLGLLLVSIY